MRRAIVLLLLLLPASGSAAELRAAVAANFREAFQPLADDYQRRTGVRVTAVFGASGMLFAQIRQQAPFDLFLSADREHPEALLAAGRALPPLRTYALGRLALWMPGHDAAPERLGDGRFALANPRLAPYGAAAEQCLERLGLWERLQAHAVYGNNVSQTFHFVASGGVAAGFVAYPLLKPHRPPPREVWLVDPACHAPIEQGAVALTGERAAQAAAFIDFLVGEEVQQRLVDLGYGARG